MLVIYEKFINDNDMEDERNIGDFDTLKEAQYFLEHKLDILVFVSNLCSRKY